MKNALFIVVTFISFSIFARGGASAIPNTSKWKEADYVQYHCRGEIEHRLPDKTRVDCLNDTHAIEYDFGYK